MAGFLLRRAVQSVAVLFAVATLTFFLLHLAPGDPLDAVAADARIPPDVRDSLRVLYGLDRPVAVQYVRHLSGIASGNFGYSTSQQRPVADVMADALPNTVLLMGAALVLAFGLGIVLGALQGARVDSRFDRLASAITTTFATLPDFWLASGISLLFAYKLRWLPIAGKVDPAMHMLLAPTGRVLDVLRHMVLPVLSFVLIAGSVVARYQRAALLDTWYDDYLRTARAAGVPGRRLLFHHALRNALLPIITVFGLSLPSLVGGAVFVETVFAWPGIGRVAVEGLLLRDYPLVLGVVMATSALVALGSILADVAQRAVDPGARHA